MADVDDVSRQAVPADRGRWQAARPRLAWAGAVVGAALVLFWCYPRLSQSNAVNSDGAGVVLQGWDMVHGNVLMSGWLLADVTFATFEAPIDGLVAAVHGLNPDAVHITAAIVYTLLVLTAALLAKGTARGAEGVVRAVLAAGILLAPGLIPGVHILLLSPDHTGIAVPIMLALLLVDRARPRWFVPVAMGVLLVWAQVDDPLATYAGAAPIAVVCGVRAALPLVRGRRLGWYDAGLAAASVVSVELARLAVSAIEAAGGYQMRPIKGGMGTLFPFTSWGKQLSATGQNLLILFGANVSGQHGIDLAVAYLHMVGVALALTGLLAGLACLVRDADRVTQILAVATLAILLAGAVATPMVRIASAHEIATVLPFSAVLAGRTVGSWLARVRWRGPRLALPLLLTAALAGYVAALGYGVAQPALPAETQDLADWLVAHHLTGGLAKYWAANSTTLSTGGRVHVYPVTDLAQNPYTWVAKSAWYDPATSRADFVIAVPGSGNAYAFPESGVRRVFGKPAHEYRVNQYIIMVWDKNLLLTVHSPGPARR